MFALLLIPLLASGQILISSPYRIRHYFRLHRYDGQLLYMKVATYGVWCFIFSVLLAYAIKWFIPEFTAATFLARSMDLSNDLKENRLSSWLILLSLGMVLVATIWTQISRLRLFIAAYILSGDDKSKSQIECNKQMIRLSLLEEILADGSFGKIFFNSAIKDKPVLVSLKSRKVYVGIVNKISEPNEKQGPNLEVSINPIMSGYRDKDTLRVLFTNDYADLGDIDTSIVFPMSEVAQVSWFDMDTHEKVDNNKEKKTISNRKKSKKIVT